MTVSPTGGYLAIKGANDFAVAVVELAKDKPAILAALQTVAKIQPGVKAFEYLSSVAGGIAADRGRLDPNSFAAATLGVTEAYAAVHPEESTDSDQYGYNNVPSAPPSWNGNYAPFTPA